MRLIISFFIAITLFTHPRDTQIDLSEAHRYFSEVQQLLQEDGGKLWGHSLEGPILLVNPETRLVIASHSDEEGNVVHRANVYTGKLPDNFPVANTAIEWAGVTWAMIMLPVATEPYARNALIIHELWHRVQEEIGFPATNPSNNHLDTKEGRIWLKLEMRALKQALNLSGSQRAEALKDALLFRTYRQSLYPDAAKEELQLENHEGLAEYTGIVLAISSNDDRIRFTIQKLKQAEQLQSYTRAFAYYTIPAYGILLDAVHPGWTRTFSHNNSLPELVKSKYAIQIDSLSEEIAFKRSKEYGGEAIIALETDRERNRQKSIAEFKQRFVTGPRLILPLKEMRISFDPRTITPLENHGKVYATIEVSDVWGNLKVTGGALLSEDWSYIIVDVPVDRRSQRIETDGYVLELKNSWQIVPGDLDGDFKVQK